MIRAKYRPTSLKLVLVICCCVMVAYNLMVFISSTATRRQTSDSSLYPVPSPKKCVVNDGKAVVHDSDPEFTANLIETVEKFKDYYDNHDMPEIETVGPSFYFQTTDPRKINERVDFPALSRAWNETYAVIDDESLIEKGDDIWGSKGLDDEYIREVMDDTSGENPIRILKPGKYATFSGWLFGNFGHYVHDHVSKIAYLKSIVSKDTKFILPHHPVHESVLNAVDKKFVKERVYWINYAETVHAPEGTLTIMKPKSNLPFVHGVPQTATVYTEHFARWLEQSHWSSKPTNRRAKNKGKVVFYSRQGSTGRRNVEPELEQVLLMTIREAMAKRGQREDDLIIFNGKGEDGETLPMEKQFEIFSSADTAIGPHGSGLTNIIWMDPRCHSENRPKVLEFASSYRTEAVQNGSFWGYWFLFGGLPWIDYHQMYYTDQSTDNEGVYIDPVVFEQTLNEMWGIGE